MFGGRPQRRVIEITRWKAVTRRASSRTRRGFVRRTVGRMASQTGISMPGAMRIGTATIPAEVAMTRLRLELDGSRCLTPHE